MTIDLPPHVLFGAAYYLEYQREPDLDRDLDLMAEAGFSLIRVGEYVWSTWEPEEGRFDVDWLQPVLDGAHARGLDVILGTPTAAVPMWLARRFPEIAGERGSGRPIGWGARQEADFSHPAFRFHAERVVRRVVERYAGHPAVIGFQVDNEPGNEIFHNHGVFQRFVDELRQTYGTVERLNEEWGLTYWSHRLSDWSDLWRPDNNAQPQYDLAWRRHQAKLTTELVGWQVAVVREYARPGQFVTTCIAYDRPAMADDAVGAEFDVTSGNAYYRMQEHLALPAPREQAEVEQTWHTTGTWSVYRTADRMWASRQEPFLVTETDATSIWGASLNEPAYDGQWRQAAWALVSRGARGIEYWHWHTLPYGTETYWGGVLPHSGKPGRVYEQISQLGAELRRAGGDVTGLEPEADLGILFDNDSKWAMAFQPPFGETEPDPRSYERIVDAWYRAAFDARRQVRVIAPRHLFARTPAEVAVKLPALVVPGFYIASDEQLDWLTAYAAAGGHLLVGIRTAYADEEARARADRQPARLAGAAGAWYDEFSNIGSLPLTTGTLALPSEARAERWVEGLIAEEGTEVLAGYDHPHFGRWAAATTRAHERGRVTVVGTHPSPELGSALIRWAVPAAHADGWLRGVDRPESVTVTGARDTTGSTGTVRFVHNWSWRPATVTVPVDSEDLLAPDRPLIEAGQELTLSAWDVRVLRERRN